MKIAINGFGRIGRLTFKFLSENNNIDIVAINDLADTKTLAHLLKYDSVHGKFSGTVDFDENHLIVNNKKILVTAEKEPSKLPWAALEIDIVLESSGHFTDKEKAMGHINAGAKKVLISAPAKGDLKTIVLGVNENIIDGTEQILSNASCTTNCLAPMVKIMDENFGILSGFISTVHSYTSDQNLHDAPHRDLRRARAAACSIIPTTTGAAKTVSLVLPHLKDKLNGNSIRVPVPSGSITDFTCVLNKKTTVEEVNLLFKNASNGNYKGIIEYCTEPIVSADIVGNKHSCIFDSELTMVIDNTVKIVGWYDNEAGYSARLADLINLMFIKHL